MSNYGFSVWSKTGGKLTDIKVSSSSSNNARKLAEAQYGKGVVLRGGGRTQ
jgi:hypothetical protein